MLANSLNAVRGSTLARWGSPLPTAIKSNGERDVQNLPGMRLTTACERNSYEILIRKLRHVVESSEGNEWLGAFCYSSLSHYENKRTVTTEL